MKKLHCLLLFIALISSVCFSEGSYGSTDTGYNSQKKITDYDATGSTDYDSTKTTVYDTTKKADDKTSKTTINNLSETIYQYPQYYAGYDYPDYQYPNYYSYSRNKRTSAGSSYLDSDYYSQNKPADSGNNYQNTGIYPTNEMTDSETFNQYPNYDLHNGITKPEFKSTFKSEFTTGGQLKNKSEDDNTAAGSVKTNYSDIMYLYNGGGQHVR